mmetsp:Transcript_114621/g.208951  ORF Transcript_114621/g.208951 Transcript_114621/m.208951 type:complete len:217 (-) Transcript_114621:148-798(-)
MSPPRLRSGSSLQGWSELLGCLGLAPMWPTPRPRVREVLYHRRANHSRQCTQRGRAPEQSDEYRQVRPSTNARRQLIPNPCDSGACPLWRFVVQSGQLPDHRQCKRLVPQDWRVQWPPARNRRPAPERIGLARTVKAQQELADVTATKDVCQFQSIVHSQDNPRGAAHIPTAPSQWTRWADHLPQQRRSRSGDASLGGRDHTLSQPRPQSPERHHP